MLARLDMYAVFDEVIRTMKTRGFFPASADYYGSIYSSGCSYEYGADGEIDNDDFIDFYSVAVIEVTMTLKDWEYFGPDESSVVDALPCSFCSIDWWSKKCADRILEACAGFDWNVHQVFMYKDDANYINLPIYIVISYND